MGPRTASQLVRAAFDLYRRYPLLFFALAAAVIVPYQVVVLVATGGGPFGRSLSFGVSSLLLLIEIALIGPLVSALHVQAVKAVGEGEEPRLGPIAKEGLRVLPVVVAATIMSWLGISLGFLLLIVPGVILLLRWYVVAQTAAVEHEGWLPALRRSRQLTAGHYGHIVVLAIYLALIGGAITLPASLAFGHGRTTVLSFAVGALVGVLSASFSALGAGLLYFDLRARLATPGSTPVPTSATGSAAGAPTAESHSLDPDRYEDHDRPRGWYVDPSAPERMRYWGLGDPPGWGATMRTPRKIRKEWRAARGDSDSPGGDDTPGAPGDFG